MPDRRVIAYTADDEERRTAMDNLRDVEDDGSAFVVGVTDDEGVDALRAGGLVVEDIDLGADRVRVSRRGAGGVAPQPVAPAPPPLVADQRGSFVLSLGGPLTSEQRPALEGAGAALVERLGRYTWLALATPEQARRVAGLGFVQRVARVGEGDDRFVDVGVDHGPVLIDLLLDGSVPAELVARDLEAVGAEIQLTADDRIRVLAPRSSVAASDPRAIPGVSFGTEGGAATFHTDRVRALIGQRPAAVGTSGFDGDGELVAVLDSGIDANHPDFAGRIVYSSASGSAPTADDVAGHGTHVAGVIAGDGSASGGTYQGIAPRALLVVLSTADTGGELVGLPTSVGDRLREAYAQGARVMNNSWGLQHLYARYTADCQQIDEFVWQHRDMVVVFSAGNDASDQGTANGSPNAAFSVTPPGTAKNVVTVGAARSDRTAGGWAADLWGVRFPTAVTRSPIANETVSGDPERLAAFSGRGPCIDHRVKPDVVAPGTDICAPRASNAPAAAFWDLAGADYAYLGGTSTAAPAVAGACAVIRQWYVTQRKTEPSAALVKATLVNGTHWLTGSDADPVPAGSEAPNHQQGFGRVDLVQSLPDIDDGLWLAYADTWKQPQYQFSKDNSRHRWQIDVDDSRPLRICLAYTDLPGSGVQNDLELLVTSPSGTKWVTNAGLPGRDTSQPDHDNLVEIVRVTEPEPGTWTIRVLCLALLSISQGWQDYAIVVTGALRTDLTFAGYD